MEGVLYKPMQGKRILIIEDQLESAMALCRALVQAVGDRHQVDICPLADVALKRLRYEQFDLIVTDQCMPGTSGLDLIRHVRQTNPHTRTILMTAFGSPAVESQARQLGAGYLLKPFSLQEFVTAAHRMLSEENEGKEHQEGQKQTSSEKEIEFQLFS